MMHIIKISTPAILLLMLVMMMLSCTSESPDTTTSESPDTTTSESLDTTTSKPTGTSAAPAALLASEDSPGKDHNDDGVRHYEQAHWDQAEGHFSQAIEADPNLAEAHYNLALALDHLGNHGAATESFKQAASLAPNNPDIAESPILKQHIGK